MIKYFLASLTIPEKDLWVNLSPDEKDRIIPTAFGLTEMGRDLLGQDYLLKQVASSAFNPDEALGKKFWDEVYRQAQEKFGTTDIPLDTRHRVWIVPSDVTVYERPDAGKGSAVALVVDAKLKVMLEVDYLALSKKEVTGEKAGDLDDFAKGIMRDIIIPALEKEVNEGAHFACLRQVYHSFILAAWYKKKLKDSIVVSLYADQSKVRGVDTGEPDAPQRIYDQYVESFKKGVFNFIREEQGAVGEGLMPRKYFSGGIVMDSTMKIVTDQALVDQSFGVEKDLFVISSAGEPVEQNVTPVVTDDSMKTEVGHRETITGPLKSKAIFNSDVFGSLANVDRARLRKVLANGDNEEIFREVGAKPWGTQEAKRAIVLPLLVPIKYKGRIYRAIYVKGILLSPTDENIPVLDKKEAGQPEIVPQWKMISPRGIPSPKGGLFSASAQTEYQNTQEALARGYLVNLPLGYGRFTNRKFYFVDQAGEKAEREVGYFSVLMEDVEPVRFLPKVIKDTSAFMFSLADKEVHWQEMKMGDLKKRLREPDVMDQVEGYRNKIKSEINMMADLGRKLHREFVHGSLNGDNIGSTGNSFEELLLVDLPTLRSWESIPTSDRLNYLLSDLMAMIRTLTLISGEVLRDATKEYLIERDFFRKDRLFVGMELDLMEDFLKGYFAQTYDDPRFSKNFEILRAMGFAGSYEWLEGVFSNGAMSSTLEDIDEGRRLLRELFVAEFKQELEKPYEGEDKAEATVDDAAAVSVEEKEGGVTEVTTASGEKFLMKTVDDKETMEKLKDEWLEVNKDFGTLNEEFWRMKIHEPGAFVVELRSVQGGLIGLSLAHTWKGLPSKSGRLEDRYVLALMELVPQERGKHLGEMLTLERLKEIVARSRRMEGVRGDVAVQPVSEATRAISRKIGFRNVPAWTIYRGEEFSEDGEVRPGDEDLKEEWWGLSLEKIESALKELYPADESIPDIAALEAVDTVKEAVDPQIKLSRMYHEMNNLLMLFASNLEIFDDDPDLTAEVKAQAASISKDLKKYYPRNEAFRDNKGILDGMDNRGGVKGYDAHFRYMLEGVQAAVNAVDVLAQKAALSGDKETWSIVQETGNNLLKFLNNICKGAPLAFDQITPQDVEVGRSLNYFAHEFSRNGHIKFVLDVDEGLHIWADPITLSDVFINLIKNAVEAIGSNEGTITISAKPDGDLVRISIKDTGSGITTDDMKRIFERGHTTKIHGSGIGLDVVKTIVKAHHGEIRAESLGKDKGAEFILRLPVNKFVFDKGGIDLGAGTMDMKVRQESGEFRFDLSPKDLKAYQNASGLTPVIFSIQPLESLPQFLGSTSVR